MGLFCVVSLSLASVGFAQSDESSVAEVGGALSQTELQESLIELSVKNSAQGPGLSQNLNEKSSEKRAPKNKSKPQKNKNNKAKVPHSEGLNPELVKIYHEFYNDQQEEIIDTEKYIPLSLRPSQDGEEVFRAIVDRSLATLSEHPIFRESQLGRVSQTVEKKMKTEIVLGSTSGKSRQSGIEHKITSNFQVLQQEVKISYSGWLKTDLAAQVNQGWALRLDLNSLQNVVKDISLEVKNIKGQDFAGLSWRRNF
jgi:hypothetical protein